MKALNRSLILIGALTLVGTTPPLWAGDHTLPATALPVTAILDRLDERGFTHVSKIKYSDGVYSIKAMNPEGQPVKYRVNAQTGSPIPQDDEDSSGKFSMRDAIKVVEDAGYHGIYEIEQDGHIYEIEAFDKNEHKAGFEVDSKTGKMSKNWF